VNFGRDAAAVVFDRYATLDVNCYHDTITDSGEGLVYRIVDDFKYEMVKASFSGVSDVHSRPFADGLEPFENPYRVRAVLCAWYVLIVHQQRQKTVLFNRFIDPLPVTFNLREKRRTVKLW
jgi:hypothetical protein